MVINDENTFRRIRTPFYYYDMPLLEQTADTVAELCRRYDIHVHYAVKANYGRRVMEVLSSRGFGADCVSGNEVVRAFECGFQPSRIMFTGVGKTDAEMAAGLRLGIQAFNVESMEELAVLDGLAERMGVSRQEAKQLIDGYFDTYPGVKSYMDRSIELARERGYTETIFHRRCYLPDINSHNAVVRGYAERNAINAPIQGSAADIIKIAMIRIHQRMREEQLRSRMILQVHDELNFTVLPEEKARLEALVLEEMQTACPLRVPLIADCGWGSNWLEAH